MAYETFDLDLARAKVREKTFLEHLRDATCEVKTDYLAKETGNIALEYEVNKLGAVERSGLGITTARYHALEYNPACYLFVPTFYLKQLAREAIKDGLTKWIGDGNNHHNALVPFRWFLNKELG